MNLQRLFIILVFLGLGCNIAAKEPSFAKISPLSLQWNSKNSQFEGYFSVINNKKKSASFSSILKFKTNKKRRWRGALLPKIPTNSISHFKISFSPEILLENSYERIALILYEGKYDHYINRSDRQIKLSSRPIIKRNEYIIQFNTLHLHSEYSAKATTLVNIGNKDQVMKVISSKKQKKLRLSLIFTGEKLPGGLDYSGIYYAYNNGIWSKTDLSANINNTVIAKDRNHKNIIQNEGESELSTKPIAVSILDLAAALKIDKFMEITPDPALSFDISDQLAQRTEILKRAKNLEMMNIGARNELISLYIAEGKSDEIADVLSDQLTKEPENLNLSLSLSKVYHKQGNITAALGVLTASLSRISLSARVALTQELKTSVEKGKSTLSNKSEQAYLSDEFASLGISLLERKKYTEALLAFQSLYSLSDEYPFIQYYLGKSRQGLEQFNQAQKLFFDQSQRKIKKEQLVTDLGALAETLAHSNDIPIIKYAITRYKGVQTYSEIAFLQDEIKQKTQFLKELLRKAIERKKRGLSDLVITFMKDFQFKNIQPKQTIFVKMKVANIGKQKSARFKVFYQLKYEKGTRIDIPDVDEFASLRSRKKPLTWRKKLIIPKDITTGKYQIVANVQQIGGEGETSLKNNQIESSSTVSVISPIADLTIAFLTPLKKRVIEYNEILNFGIRLNNKGQLDSPEIKMVYRFEHEFGGDNIQTVQKIIKYLPISKRDSFSIDNVSIKIPDSLKRGKYRIRASIVLVDPKKDMNPIDNFVLSPFIITLRGKYDGKPELVIRDFLPKIIAEPENLKYRILLSKAYQTLKRKQVAKKFLASTVAYITPFLQLAENKSLKDVKLINKISVPMSDIESLADELNKLGQTFLKEKKYNHALSTFQSLKAIVPAYLLVNQSLGYSRFGLKQYRQAKEAFLKQTQIDSNWDSLLRLTDTLAHGFDIQTMEYVGMQYEKLSQTPIIGKKKISKFKIASQVKRLQAMILDTKHQLILKNADIALSFEKTLAVYTISPGEVIPVQFSVNNSGNKPNNPFEVSYQFSNSKGNTFDSKIKNRFSGIKPGAKTLFWTAELIVPDNIIKGKYKISANIEFGKNKVDRDERNNQTQSDYLFTFDEQDIRIISFTYKIKKISVAGTEYQSQLLWENAGGKPATNNKLTINLININQPKDIVKILETNLEDINANSNILALSQDFIISKPDSDKGYYLHAEITGDGTLKETNLSNNSFVGEEISKAHKSLTDANLVLSQVKFRYEKPVFKLVNLYPANDVLVPGKEFILNLSMQNNGLSSTKREKLSLFLERDKTIAVGEINVEPVPPSDRIVTTGYKLILPTDTPLGTYILVIRNNEKELEKKQEIRYKNPVSVSSLQAILPQGIESYRFCDTPLFSWNGIDNFAYRLAFSTKPDFANESEIFRVPNNQWIGKRTYRPMKGEWDIIWLMSQNTEKSMFWRIEAKASKGKIISSESNKINLRIY